MTAGCQYLCGTGARSEEGARVTYIVEHFVLSAETLGLEKLFQRLLLLPKKTVSDMFAGQLSRTSYLLILLN